MKKHNIDSIVAAIQEELNVDELKLRSPGRRGDVPLARCMFRYFSKHFLNWDEDQISDWLNQSRVSKYSFKHKHDAAMQFDKVYQIVFNRIYNKLSN